MGKLSYVEDNVLDVLVKRVLDKAQHAYVKAELDLYTNTLDPLSALIDTMRQNITLSDWLEQEKSRQVQKTLQNAVGEFHQDLLGSVTGWDNPGRGGGYDLINVQKKVFVELKNKHNTLNSSSAESTYRKLERYLNNQCAGYTAYIVFIVPKRSEDYDKPWSPNSQTMHLRNDIRQIDGESFYDLVTGEKGALLKLFTVLPEVISTILKTTGLSDVEQKLFKELFLKTYK